MASRQSISCFVYYIGRVLGGPWASSVRFNWCWVGYIGCAGKVLVILSKFWFGLVGIRWVAWIVPGRFWLRWVSCIGCAWWVLGGLGWVDCAG